MMLFGVLVLIVSILLFFIPLFGGYFTIIPAILAIFVGRKGALYALIGVILNGIHVMMLSDFIRFNAVSGIQQHNYVPAAIYIGLSLLQVIAGVVIWFRHFPETLHTLSKN